MRLSQMKGKSAPPSRGEARGQQPGYSPVSVGTKNDLECLRLPRALSNQTRGEQRSQIIGTAPQNGAAHSVNGLEIEPVRDASLEIDQNILRHGIAVSESCLMKLRECADCKFDRPLLR